MALIINPDPRRFNKRLIKRAEYLLFKYCNGEAKAIRLPHHREEHKKELYKLELGMRHRLVSSDLDVWELMTHEDYAKLFCR